MRPFAAFAFAMLLGCGSRTEVPPLAPSPASEAEPVVRGATADAPTDVAPREGRSTFVGMVRPRKGGYGVGEVFFGDGELERFLRPRPGEPRDFFVGATVEVVAVLAAHVAPAQKPGEPIMQMRSSGGYDVASLVSVRIVRDAETIEGTLARSKGFFAVGDHLVGADDVVWAVPGGGKEGDRVRLRGRARVERCAPDAQCLLGGSLPIFDVASGARLP